MMPDQNQKIITNRFFPLPQDYDTLTKEGQREARKAVLRDQSTPEKFVQAWSLFRNLYLRPLGNFFYKKGFVASPPFHYEMMDAMGKALNTKHYGLVARAAPRGFGKSVILKEVALLLTLTRPYFIVTFCQSTEKLLAQRFDDLIEQFLENPLILEDFGLQRRKRGTGLWSHSCLRLVNGATIYGYSVIGKKRGGRPHLFLLDDPENDPENEAIEAQQLMLEKFERIMFRQILPMLEKGSAVYWMGTLIHRRSFLYFACLSDDKRFSHWDRRVYDAIVEDPNTNKVEALWPNKESLKDLALQEEILGHDAFMAEMRNQPMAGTERLFKISPHANEYQVDGELRVPDDPFTYTQKVHWFERRLTNSLLTDEQITPEGISNLYTEQCKPYNEVIAPMFRAITFDYASGLHSYNDYSCIAVWGLDRTNTLWVLDMWMGRARDAQLEESIFDYGLKWRVRYIGIEAVSIQTSFADHARDRIEQRTMSLDWKPRVIPIHYPANVSKGTRISGMEWRFRRGRIKYPSHLSHVWPFNELYIQTRDFTKDLALLRRDDGVETVSMHQYMIKQRPPAEIAQRITNPIKMPVSQRIREQVAVAPGMMPLQGINPDMLSPEDFDLLINQNYDKLEKDKHSRIHRPIVFG